MLHFHSKYSLRYGIKSPEFIVDYGIQNGYEKIALTDINNTSAALHFIQYAQQRGLKIAAGVDIRNDLEKCYVLIAKNNRGFHELNNFLSRHLHEEKTFPPQPGYLPNCEVIYPLSSRPDKLQSNEWIGVRAEELNQFFLKDLKHKQKFVCLQPMTFESKRDFNTHRLLRAIDKNTLLSKLTQKDHAQENDRLIPREILYKKFGENYEFILHQTEQLLKGCEIRFEFHDAAPSQNLKTYSGSVEEDRKLIEELCRKGLSKRYPQLNKTITDRIQREIEVIEKKEYLAYFLITWDIINYATSRGYFHVGRGSGANSIVAYLLGITDVDPLELDLYFERFINLYRKNPPDFDIDFSWKERDEVTQYIFDRFPTAALLCTYQTFQYKGTVRELGKVFGLPKSDIDILSSGKYNYDRLDEMNRLVLKYGKYIEGLPSHLSVHTGGIVISEKPITWFGATFLPPKGYPTTQFSMLEAEDVGLYKFDILSQRGLSKIHDSLKIIKENRPEKDLRDIHDLCYFKSDIRIRKLLETGDAMGCFYVESPAMRMLMKKLKTSTYLELVAASSIIRPGVSGSGMMQEYILRHKDEKRRATAHPTLLEIMPETYGVMVYQEDVIKVAHHFAGLTLDEADILRRGMSGKYRSRGEFRYVEEKFFDNCLEKGYSPQLTSSVWKQIESFAGYAFSKGHSASYAVESFQSLYLKAYFPLEYMVATINNFGGYYRTEFYVHEARRLGAVIEAPCIQNSLWETRIINKTVYLGFNLINGIFIKEMQRMLTNREKEGEFQDFDSFIERTNPTMENLVLLIRIGAFRNFQVSKKNLQWRTHLFFRKTNLRTEQMHLFSQEKRDFKLPVLHCEPFEQAFEEMELLGFPLCDPFSLLTQPVEHTFDLTALPEFVSRTITLYGYLVSTKSTKTSKKELMYFGTFLDANSQTFDTVHFPDIARKFPFMGRGIYKITGKVMEEFGYYSIETQHLEKLNFIGDPRYEESETPKTQYPKSIN
ncbi:MAG: DNA polymerase III subunit alpha [Brumimicrobium sp.]|nr:DNA polymerase III subunit alpha [Brumimicrobium sp.]